MSRAAPRPFIDGVLAILANASSAPPGVPGVTAGACIWVWEFQSQNASWALWPGLDDGVIDALTAYNRRRWA